MDNIYKNQYDSILHILLSTDSIIINDILQSYYKIKVLIKYDVDKIYNLLKIYLDEKLEINNNKINKLYNIITIKFEENQEYYIYCYNYSLSKYIYSTNEGLFDCNLIFMTYNNYYFVYNKFNISYDDIYYRILNKKFCYLLNNFEDLENLLINNLNLSNLLKLHFFNKMTYALKLVQKGWIMDEYYIKEKSWTINYWSNYIKYLSLIKFNNNLKINIEKKCHLCGETFNLDDVVFNINDIYIHYSCIINKLCN